jgi:hypothetical protein
MGSGLYLQAPALLLHTTLARNTGGDGSGITVISSTVQLTNTILVSHTVGINLDGSSTAILEATLWGYNAWANAADWAGAGTIMTGTRNIRAVPLFINPEAMDYHLSAASPAIDQGVSTWVDSDIDNQPRPNPSTGLPDLGADEYWLPVAIDQVIISGPSVVSATLPISYTANVSPADATPNIVYNWSPYPVSGQGTPIAFFIWLNPGTYTVTVTARNVSGSAMASLPVLVLPGPVRSVFFPVIMYHGAQ